MLRKLHLKSESCFIERFPFESLTLKKSWIQERVNCGLCGEMASPRVLRFYTSCIENLDRDETGK